jgi:SHS2 domain-containing protein
MAGYSLLAHTADIGLKVEAPTLNELFRYAAEGMTALITGGASLQTPDRSFSVEVEGQDAEMLLVSWLNELLYLNAVHKVILTRFEISKLTLNRLSAIVRGYAREGAPVNVEYEIKAATYHQLKIVAAESGYKTTIIFDV